MTNNLQHAKTAISGALATIAQAYWEACQTEGRAIDPRDLGMSDTEAEILDEEYDIAQRIEEQASSQGMSFSEAKEFFL